MTWNLLGHDWAAQLLKEHILREDVRHAYLFTGPRGVGRRTLALRFAQALNCPQPQTPGEPCQVCRTCKRIARMQHPDLTVIQSEGPGGMIRVEQIREMQHSLALAPYEARYRVALLVNFETAHPSASNALLKTLEEPPPQVLILLTAESGERLLPTIVSRCEALRLRPLPLETVSKGLETRWEVPPEQSKLLAHLSGGRPGYALRLFQEADRFSQRQTWLEDHAHLLSASRRERFNYADTLAKDKDLLREALHVYLTLWRDVLLRLIGSSAPYVNLDRAEEIARLAKRLDVKEAHRMVLALEKTLDLLDHNVNPRLAVEVLFLDMPRV